MSHFEYLTKKSVNLVAFLFVEYEAINIAAVVIIKIIAPVVVNKSKKYDKDMSQIIA